MSDIRRTGDRATRATRRAGLLLLPLAYLAGSFACSSGHKRPSDLGGGLDLDHGRVDAGASTTPDETPDAGDLPDQTESGADAGAGPANQLCGNGVIDLGEDCDGTVDVAQTCRSRGFDSGSLSCGVDCRFDTSTCSGTENCFDGRDNDGDGLVDCADSDECSASCTDPCASPLLIAETATVSGSTRGRSSMLAASCSQPDSTGPDVAYELHVSQDAKLDVRLTSTQALNLSVRSSCGDDSSELSCSSQTRVTLDAHAGDVYYLVIDGDYKTDAGDYVLDVHTRQVVCGDGIRDSSERCDDGNTTDGDGCDSSCNLEASESEPNGQRSSADNYNQTPWIARISSASDIDYYRVNVPEGPGSIVVRTLDLGDNACAYNLMDTVVEIFDTNTNGNALLASDDDGGVGKCSLAVVSGLAPGNYFVKVTAAGGASPASFPYKLDISVGVCGDGEVTLAEECDDGNLIDGDGCDSSCVIDFGG
jgi:cysteine-rich repeat protein